MSSRQPRVKWTVKSAARRRVLAGHPWVFANDLTHSPKDLEPGALVDLYGQDGSWLAWGYGNPNSLIAFRVLGTMPWNRPEILLVIERLREAWAWRERAGLTANSFRWCFAEGDGLPGLIVDAFMLASGERLLAVQILTAGMERLLREDLVEALTSALPAGEKLGGVILHSSSSVRALEGLPVGEPVIKFASGPAVDSDQQHAELSDAILLVSNSPRALGLAPLKIHANLVAGQKTGFFLDQSANRELLAGLWRPPGEVAVLDLFCYVGQWGAQAAALAARAGGRAEVDLVDASQSALTFAQRNVVEAGGVAQTHRLDILDEMSALARVYDLVVCDPPAFIKSRKHIPTGEKAYEKVFTQALARVKPGGMFVACSCSHHLSEPRFREILESAAAKAERRVSWLAYGGQAPDHPIRSGFPEGHYLKSAMGLVAGV